MSTKGKRYGGRQTKLNEELIAQMETALKAHTSVTTACDMLGITRETHYKWLREGEAAKSGLKADYSDSVKKSQAMSKVVLVNAISKDPAWQAKAWILERLHPQEFGRRQLIAHAGHDGESPMPVGDIAPVRMVVNFQGVDKGEAPWIHREETDPEPLNGSDPWESEAVKWDGETNASKAPPTAPAPEIVKAPLDTGGKARDPDEP